MAEDYKNGVFCIGSSGEYVARIDGEDVGYASTFIKASRILSNERLARATHRHITFDDLQAMRAAGTFGEYLTSLDADGMASVAHMLVTANHAAGNLVQHNDVLDRLYAVRDQQARLVTAANEAMPTLVLIVAEYSREAEQIVIRRGWNGEIIHYCNTWLEVEAYKQGIGSAA